MDVKEVVVCLSEDSDEAVYIDGQLRIGEDVHVYACEVAREVGDSKQLLTIELFEFKGEPDEWWPDSLEVLRSQVKEVAP